jgi:hypothetical protein
MVVASNEVRVRRSGGIAALVTVGIALVSTAVTYSIVAMPFYVLARATEPGQSLQRPFFRDAILHVALPGSIVLGLAIGGLVGVWYARGGTLPHD